MIDSRQVTGRNVMFSWWRLAGLAGLLAVSPVTGQSVPAGAVKAYAAEVDIKWSGTVSGTVGGAAQSGTLKASARMTATLIDKGQSAGGILTANANWTVQVDVKLTSVGQGCSGVTTASQSATSASGEVTLKVTGGGPYRWVFSDSTAIPAAGQFKLDCEDPDFHSTTPLSRPYPVMLGPLEGDSSSLQIEGKVSRNSSETVAGLTSVYQEEITYKFTAVELVIDPTPYATWRPVAGADENTPPPADKDLEIRATLQQVGGQPAPAKAKKFTFELVKTSQQLGTTMNYPLKKVAKTTFDLQFLPERNTELTVSNEGQKAETRTGEFEKVTAKVTPFDYGGWSTIRVTAEMPDGSKIVGHLRGATEQDVRLPKRAPDSKIADAWKKEKGVDLADDDDKEGFPSGLQGCDGDGLTLYEEYRGFMENSEHIEGDPNRKDLFIYNNGGPIIDFGISLFATQTFLVEGVHKRLTKAEVDLENRIINENWTPDAAHAVDQHALIINSDPARTAIVWDGGQGKRGRPKIVKAIDIAPDQEDVRDWSYVGVFPTEGGGTYESVWLGARTVLHMLLHAVGVEHHGPADLDRFVDLTFLWPEDPGNTYGRPVFVHTEYGLITLLDERTGADFAPTYLAARQRAVERDMAWVDSRHSGPLHDALVSYLKGSSLTLLLGLWNGPHSGAEDCPMRRHYADAYPSASGQGDYFLVPPGTEPAGINICRSEKGTGINAKGREPQGRYYDALGAGYASCGSWICINDAFPLTDRPPNAGRRFVTR
ncbi:MAG: hypothetical protein JNN08_28395 [Bryobacterales bacterium]|nr:hypothetical protein [Bryobacterales bacterium]